MKKVIKYDANIIFRKLSLSVLLIIQIGRNCKRSSLSYFISNRTPLWSRTSLASNFWICKQAMIVFITAFSMNKAAFVVNLKTKGVGLIQITKVFFSEKCIAALRTSSTILLGRFVDILRIDEFWLNHHREGRYFILPNPGVSMIWIIYWTYNNFSRQHRNRLLTVTSILQFTSISAGTTFSRQNTQSQLITITAEFLIKFSYHLYLRCSSCFPSLCVRSYKKLYRNDED